MVGAFLRSMGAIPVQNEVPLAGIRRALRILENNGTMAIFPEGRISRLNILGPFQTGWAYLALKAGATVLPVAINIDRSVRSPATLILRRRRISVQIGEPWTIEKTPHPHNEIMETINNQLIEKMERLLSEG